MRKGVHVLSEKPIAVTVKAADAMIAVAKETGMKLGVDFQLRTDKSFRQARKAIEDGLVGEIYRTNIVAPYYRTQAYYNSAARSSGGAKDRGITVTADHRRTRAGHARYIGSKEGVS
jgi:predicted dehydrogenase